MHMHCVFFNLVGAKSRRVPLLVPTSSLSLLQWPLLYKHVAEIQLPRANEQNQADNTAQKAKHHLGSNHGATELLSWNEYVMALRAVRQSQREGQAVCMMGHWCHGKSNTEQWFASLKFSLLHTAHKTFSSKSERFYDFFSLLILLKGYWEGIILYSLLHMQWYK